MGDEFVAPRLTEFLLVDSSLGIILGERGCQLEIFGRLDGLVHSFTTRTGISASRSFMGFLCEMIKMIDTVNWARFPSLRCEVWVGHRNRATLNNNEKGESTITPSSWTAFRPKRTLPTTNYKSKKEFVLWARLLDCVS